MKIIAASCWLCLVVALYINTLIVFVDAMRQEEWVFAVIAFSFSALISLIVVAWPCISTKTSRATRGDAA